MTTLLRFRVQGTVEEAESGRPLSRHIVRAFDKDLLFDDELGTAITDEEGRFLIQFTQDAFRDFMELSPDVYLRVYDSTGERFSKRASMVVPGRDARVPPLSARPGA
jgi:hypothetical protein